MKKTYLQKLVDEAFKEWQKEHTPESIKQFVHERLNKQKSKILHQIMGFEVDSWKDWEVDHCNGRMSQINTFISETSKAEGEKWIKENMGSLPKLSKVQIKKIKQEYERELKRTIDNVLSMHARNEGVAIANRILEEKIEEKLEKSAELQ